MGDADDPRAGEEAFADLLDRHRDDLVAYLQRTAQGLARWEGAEDLAQHVHLRALHVRERLEWRGEAAFRRWLEAIARQVVADRAAYWKALKRDAGHLLRITAAEPASEPGRRGIDPADRRTGPVTFTMRRDALRSAALALSALSARDQRILGRLREGWDTAAIAADLDLAPASAQRAIHRARVRFEQAFAALQAR